MGYTFADKYSLLHFATGIVARFWSIGLIALLIVHIIFEATENTKVGMNFINKYIPFWPGGKTHPDVLLNRFGDTTFTGLGWLLADVLFKWDPYF
jgi:hypothetical protein